MKPGLVIEEKGDIILYPQTPFTAEQWEDLLDKTALTLQRWTRGWLARKRLREMKFVRFVDFCLRFRELLMEQARTREEETRNFDENRCTIERGRCCSS